MLEGRGFADITHALEMAPSRAVLRNGGERVMHLSAADLAGPKTSSMNSRSY
jgi:hypothetical protein